MLYVQGMTDCGIPESSHIEDQWTTIRLVWDVWKHVKMMKKCHFSVRRGLYVFSLSRQGKSAISRRIAKTAIISDIFENIAHLAPLRRSARRLEEEAGRPFWRLPDPQLGQDRGQSGPRSVPARAREVTFWTGIWCRKRVSGRNFVSQRKI